MAILMAKLKPIAWSRISRVIERFQSRRLCLFLLVSVVALGIACVLPAKANTSSPQPTPEYFRQKAALESAEADCVEVHYFTWGTFALAVRERALVTDAWTCRSTMKFAMIKGLAEELAAMKWEPLEKRPRDYRLSCTVTFNEDEKPVTLSFGKYPFSVCLNGRPFKPSWNLFLRVSEFLPYEARRELLRSVRDRWPLDGYPKIPEEEDGEKEHEKERSRPSNGDGDARG